MKLTQDQRVSLYELTLSTGRPDSSTRRLVELGLAESGSGKFGGYVRITAKGRAFTATFTRDEQLAILAPDTVTGRDAPGIAGGSAPPTHPAAEIQAKRPSSHTHVATKPPAASLKVGAPSPKSKLGNSKAPKASMSPAGSAAVCRETSNAESVGSVPSTPPNAVRVTTGARVVYYPLDTYEKLNGQKKRVFTRNRFYRSYALEASGGDV